MGVLAEKGEERGQLLIARLWDRGLWHGIELLGENPVREVFTKLQDNCVHLGTSRLLDALLQMCHRSPSATLQVQNCWKTGGLEEATW